MDGGRIEPRNSQISCDCRYDYIFFIKRNLITDCYFLSELEFSIKRQLTVSKHLLVCLTLSLFIKKIKKLKKSCSYFINNNALVTSVKLLWQSETY